MDELNGIFADVRRPLAAVNDLERREPPGLLGRLAQYTDADLDEGLTGFRGIEALAGDEFLHRAADRIVKLRIVFGIPAAEVAVTAGLQIGDDARPVEPRRPIVTTLGIRQIQDRGDETVRDLHCGRIGRVAVGCRYLLSRGAAASQQGEDGGRPEPVVCRISSASPFPIDHLSDGTKKGRTSGK